MQQFYYIRLFYKHLHRSFAKMYDHTHWAKVNMTRSGNKTKSNVQHCTYKVNVNISYTGGFH